MDISMLLLILRAALLGASFSGLCAAARARFSLSRFVSPYLAACTVIAVEMIAGMLGGLQIGFWLLYLGGFAGLIYAHGVRKIRPAWDVIALFGLLSVYLAWRFWPSRLYFTDDFAHWAVAARLLLETNAFPSAATPIVTFQSYPLGSASFIYYICRTLGNHEGLWLIAQNLLSAMLILPVFAHVKRRSLAILSPAVFLLLFKSFRPLGGLYVDWLLAYCGIGIAAAILDVKDRPGHILLVSLPGMLAAVFFKSSGIFFCACSALLIGWCFALQGQSRRKQLGAVLLAIGVSALAFVIWTIHVKLAFSAGLDSKHAVSLTAYAKEASGKSLSLIVTIAKKMILTWLRPAPYLILFALFMAGALLIAHLMRRREALRRTAGLALRGICAAILVYGLWFAMVFAMYVFSMPASEAKRLAAYARYDSTGVLYAMGLMLIVLLRLLSALPDCRNRALWAGAAILSLCAAPMLNLGDVGVPLQPFYTDLITRETTLTEYRASPQALLRQQKLEPDGVYIIYIGPRDATNHHAETYYNSKFELHAADIAVLGRMTMEKYADAPYALVDVNQVLTSADPFEYVADRMDDIDALLVYSDDAEFDAHLQDFLAAYSGDTPVLYAYK